jgi:hypothetical protein
VVVADGAPALAAGERAALAGTTVWAWAAGADVGAGKVVVGAMDRS